MESWHGPPVLCPRFSVSVSYYKTGHQVFPSSMDRPGWASESPQPSTAKCMLTKAQLAFQLGRARQTVFTLCERGSVGLCGCEEVHTAQLGPGSGGLGCGGVSG
jgi:hypothetical protein